MQTVLATFDDNQAARTAADQLIAQGFARSSVHLQSGAAPTSSGVSRPDKGLMAGIGEFFERLFDSDDKTHAGNYAEAVRRGSTVLAVDARNDAEVAKARSVMSELGTIDIENRAQQWRSK